jgi:putative hemolysin
MHIRLRSLLLPLLLLAVVISVAPPLVTPASAAACHGSSACPDPKSCGGWSTLVACDSPYCEEADSFCLAKGAQLETYQLKEQFRACTLSDGSQCLEWMTFSFRARCGC